MAKRTSRCRAVWRAIVTVNEQPWEPPAGYAKVRCDMCDLWFAQLVGVAGERCPDCALSYGR